MITKFILSFFLLVSFSFHTSANEKIILPPDPGPDNNNSLSGIDSNKNNVRDDVEIFIFKEISSDPKIFNAYLKYSESQLGKILNADNIEVLKKLDDQSYFDIVCIGVHDHDNRNQNYKKLSQVFSNTKERRQAFQDLAKKHKYFTSSKKSVPDEEKSGKCRF